MMNKKNKSFIVLGIILISTSLTVGLLKCNRSPIQEVNYKRDLDGIIKNLQNDAYWLAEDPEILTNEYVDYMVKTHSRNKSPRSYGKLHIKVLRKNNQLAGFVTYEKENYHLGEIQFLSVNKDFRGKGYGKLLLDYATKDLFKMGCRVVRLVTRDNNVWAQRVYKNLGFVQTYNFPNGIVEFTLYKK